MAIEVSEARSVTSKQAQQITALIALAAVLATLGIGLYMARPWSDSSGYTSGRDYFGLALFLAFACSPHIYLLLRALRPTCAMTAFVQLASAVLVGVGAIVIMTDTAFIHPDAQGGLLFLVLPFYQWLVLAGAEVLARLLDRRIRA